MNTLVDRINMRLRLDCIMTTREGGGRKKLDQRLVRQMWKGLVENESDLPRGWPRQAEVLVGIC